VELFKGFLEAVNGSGPRFQHHNDLGLIGELVFPPIKRAGGGEDRAAGDQASIEQGSDELGGFVGCGKCSENDDGVGVAQEEDPDEGELIRM
jgi:hypothetical protein